MTAKRLLLIEDDHRSVLLIAHVFTPPRYEMRTTESAQAALALLETFAPHLILLDLKLPDMHGLELLRALRRDPRTRSTPIIAVTAYAMKGDAEQALRAGVTAYITKPLDRAALAKVVHQHLGTNETATE